MWKLEKMSTELQLYWIQKVGVFSQSLAYLSKKKHRNCSDITTQSLINLLEHLKHISNTQNTYTVYVQRQ